MAFYGEEEYARRSPGLEPVYPTLECSTPLVLNPLWLTQDIASCPLALVSIEYQSDGLEARRRLYEDYSRRFADTILLHHLAPNDPELALELGMNGLKETDDSEDEHSEGLYDSVFRGSLPQTRPFHEKAIASKAKKTRLGLPITLNPGTIAAATVLACADTGADVNIMSEEVAKALGFTEYESGSETKQFRLANGKIIESVGTLHAICAFGTETIALVHMLCVFHVLTKAVAPVIMGMQFLEETETMTKHRERLVRVPRPALQALSVCSIDRPKKVLSCNLHRTQTIATADTGSEIDLISPQVAANLGVSVYEGEEIIELADGTFVITSGYIFIVVSVDTPVTRLPMYDTASSTMVQFHLLQGLAHKILIGEETLEKLGVFTENQHALIPAPADNDSLELNGIRSHGSADKLRPWLQRLFQGQQSSSTTTGSEAAMHSDEDQRENYRREQEAKRIASLPSTEQQAAKNVEAARQRQYDNKVNGPTPEPSQILDLDPFLRQGSGHVFDRTTFTCDYPACDVGPFQTQYLLATHMDTHSDGQPYFCAVTGCPRSKGGKGFKRKNEMIRHGLVHQTPGYVCPFCPDREHKYPRPDFLQRHVRVHHGDKDRDDPELRDVLAQRPEGGSRGRRRRISSHEENT